jgi:flagellar hook-length control protein FliK
MPVASAMIQPIQDLLVPRQSSLSSLSAGAFGSTSATGAVAFVSNGELKTLPLGEEIGVNLSPISPVTIGDTVTEQGGNSGKLDKSLIVDRFPESIATIKPSESAALIPPQFAPLLVSKSIPQLETLNPMAFNQVPAQMAPAILMKSQADVSLASKSKPQLPTLNTMQIEVSQDKSPIVLNQVPAQITPEILGKTQSDASLVSKSKPQLLASSAMQIVVSQDKSPIVLNQVPAQITPEILGKTQSDASLVSKSKPQLPTSSAMQIEVSQEKAPIVLSQVSVDIAPVNSIKPSVEAFTEVKNLQQLQPAVSTHHELIDAKTTVVLSQTAVPQDIAATLVASGVSEVWVRQQERSSPKSAWGQSGVGVEGIFGQTVSGNKGARNDFEVTDPSAVVPDTKIAETVSYWVTHGVQSAELKLDGFGGDPVEVSISLNGDQAHIEFRTDQVDVRQALEGATTQLKEMLSSEGLQLTGVWVGASGGGSSQGDNPQQRPGAKHTAFVQAPVIAQKSSRIANLSVGQSLDIFV